MKLSSSSRSEPHGRGQVEPVAALIAVTFLVIGVLIFTGYHQEVMNTDTEREIDEPTLNRIYDDIYTADGFTMGSLDETLSDVSASSLPHGYYVHVNFYTISSDGTVEQLPSATFNPNGERIEPLSSEQREMVTTETNSSTAKTADRPVALTTDDGMRGARLEITVWER